MKPDSGRVIGGKYRLVEPLGAGGMGSVWRARHLELENEVAIKLLSPELAQTAGGVDRFKREARAAARLRSVHVVQIHDYGVEDGQPYMVMELLEGEDLRQRLRREPRTSLARTVEIVRPVCKALQVAHQAGIVHRDVKPPNVFLARSAEDEVVKVLDFGIAKEQSAAPGQETSGNVVLGSPLYMSPEQARAGRVDHRSDLWSVAVVTFELLTAEQPFQGASLGDVFARICGDEIPLPSDFGVVHPDLDDFFRKALARDPDQRYRSALDLAEALAEVAGASPSATALPELGATPPGSRPAGLASSGDSASGRRGRDSDTLALAATTPGGAQADESSKVTAAPPNRARLLVALAATATVAVGASVLWRGSTSSDDEANQPTATASAPAAPAGEESASAAAQAPSAPQAQADSAATAPSAAPSSSAAPKTAARAAGVPRAAASATTTPATASPTAAPSPQLDPVFGVPVSKPPPSAPGAR